jgi:hypothetical protein
MKMLLGNGNGMFQAPRNFAVGLDANSVAVGDFNGDGRPDFAVSNVESTFLSVFTHSGGGNFSSSTITIQHLNAPKGRNRGFRVE